MESIEYLSKKKILQITFMKYIDEEENSEENFVNLCNLINDQKIKADVTEFRLFLHFIDVISSNYHRKNYFFIKIEKVLLLFKEEFKKYLTVEEVFNIFKYDKRIFLFLLENKIVEINFVISNFLKNYQHLYPEYFLKEIRSFVSIQSDLLNDPKYEEKRKIGENDHIICQIIRNDCLNDFIIYVNKNNLPLTQTIEESIFETNSFLLFMEPSLIEYSAFFGSIRIFKYLLENKVKLTPSLWFYSIHGANLEFIHILEENQIEPQDKTYKSYFNEAIRCHNYEMIQYFKNKLVNFDEFICIKSIEFYYYINLPDDLFNLKNFYFFCKYDYYFFASQYLNTKKININQKFADVIESNPVILTPLLAAIYSDNYEIVKLLLNQDNINVNVIGEMSYSSKNEVDLNALMIASFSHNLKIIDLLLKCEDIDVNKILISKYCYENSFEEHEEKNILIKAINDENAGMVKLLLSHPDIDVNVKFKSTKYNSNYPNKIFSYMEKSVLEMAIEKEYVEIVKILLNHPKIDVNCISHCFDIDEDYDIENTPLNTAVAINNLEIVQLLLSNPNIEVNQISTYKEEQIISEKTALTVGIQKKYIEIVKFLLEHPKIDVNQLSLIKKNGEDQVCPLYYAINGCDTEIISLLLAHKDINVNLRTVLKSSDGSTTGSLLLSAITSNKKEIINLLLNCKDINVNDTVISENSNSYVEKSILSFAVDSHYDDMLRIILDHPRINVNVADYVKKERGTKIQIYWLLHKVICMNRIDIITKILDKKNIDVNVKSKIKILNDDGSIVVQELPTLYFAITQRRLDIVKLLLAKENLDIESYFVKKVTYPDGFCDVEKKSLIQVAITEDCFEIFLFLFNYLIENGKLVDDLNELAMMTKNRSIKSVIYSNINK